MEKVVVTGLGAVSALGLSSQQNWENAVGGLSGVGKITLFDSKDYLVNIACEVKNFQPEAFISPKEARRRDRFEQFATVAAAEAVRQAGIEVTEENAGRIGVVVSSAVGGLQSLTEAEHTLFEQGARRISPFAIPMLMANGAAGIIGIDYGFQGPAFSVASACASGADGIGVAWNMIRNGVIDVALTGASEACITPLGVNAFDRLGALSRRNDDYSMTPQPFDRNRDGLVMGEGSGLLVIESESHAKQRGAEVLAELAGYASTADAYHITAPSETGAGGAKAIQLALKSAGVAIDQVNYINAHGTATELNDLSETRAIKTAFGAQAYKIPVSSTKSMTGHMMGATGALEAVFCVMAVRENIIPPTIHYQTPDPECDLDYVPNEARQQITNITVSNAFGFGGHNAVLVIRKYR